MGKDQWRLKVYDGMTAPRSSRCQMSKPPIVVFDFDGDGTSEIAIYQKSDLSIGNVRDGKWSERIAVGGGPVVYEWSFGLHCNVLERRFVLNNSP